MRLIDADKLIAQLKRYTWNMDADDAGYAMAIHDLLQDIDSQDTVQPTVNPWISVKERLPKYGDYVLGLGPKHGYYICEYRGLTGLPEKASPWFTTQGRSVKITHWMPLPEPPKEGGRENG